MATHSCSCLENPRDNRAWWAAVSRVKQSRTQLKRLSSSSSQNKRLARVQPIREMFRLGLSQSWQSTGLNSANQYKELARRLPIRANYLMGVSQSEKNTE